MRILILHNRYRHFGGEEAVVNQMIDIYHSLGYETQIYFQSTNSVPQGILGNLKIAISTYYNAKVSEDIQSEVKKFKPDIVHIHNLYPLIPPKILSDIRKLGVKIIMTVHNYRLACPTGLFLRKTANCEKCLEKKNPLYCIYHNCENDIFKSIVYSLRNLYVNKKRYYFDNVDKFICLTNFQKQKLIKFGISVNKLIVIPNFSTNYADSTDFEIEDDGYIAFIGRLSHEKGWDIVVEAARRYPNIRFSFAAILNQNIKIKNLPINCEFNGFLSGNKLDDFIRNSKFIVIPSRVYEGFPMVVLDAFRHNKTVIAPNHGGFPEIVVDGFTGLLFRPGDMDDFCTKIQILLDDANIALELGRNALYAFNNNYELSVVRKKWQILLEDVYCTK